MKLSILLSLTLTLANASPIIRRDGAAVVSAITTLANQLTALNSTVTSYEGGLAGSLTAVEIQLQDEAVVTDLQAAVTVTQQSANFTETESEEVAVAVLDLEPKIVSVLANLVAKKPDFETGLLGVFSLDALVKSDLQQQKILAARLGDAIVAKLTATYAAVAPLINDEIADQFDSAIAAFSS
ncbi:hypothetical protein ASPZODRAFT_130113 [Penicilliopsis zonata CBS 506.65]|uniref:Cell wall mannoprotein 1 n=1 Tax=Penicilliopsis zonata CBS 506.65 TaxID=1073090 RepID=A0A1L9SM84_9EURO|nr:hypothetical protein ASPZODRAFT_130113 [Penicilliopsis zonata CBS 506.65]OJJ48164.1 hypothetical protein ASPZODRAFT_130113 [Penicilliopsis zonata CBS 506.65]